ncbi:MAG: DNA mismatch repair endonuclease MutL [Rikenellaceae bacterium]
MIELLPIHIANQIAAGEVVQRGASIVKELIENAIDSGASRVSIRVIDGGRTVVQVVDNGCGMSEEDASKAFLRHATSKIRTAEDLFNLRTFGFRGEALASIASVAEVELITKRKDDELGTRVVVRDGVEVVKEPCASAEGTSITVKNLFYSVPARRKFLKSEAYESRLCKSEFIRVAMINESIAFEYSDSLSQMPLILAPQNRHARIVALTRSSYSKKLLSLEVDSPLLRIKGYIGTPDTAKSRGRGEQYLFVNGRYFRNNRFFKSICQTYDRLISGDSAPIYFLCLEVDEDKIDVNINPTKTEIRFEEEDAIVQILASAVRQTLGKNNIIETIDFTPSEIDIPSYTPTREFSAPPSFTPTKKYNPFDNSDWDSEEIPKDFDEMKALNDESLVLKSLGSDFGGSHSNADFATPSRPTQTFQESSFDEGASQKDGYISSSFDEETTQEGSYVSSGFEEEASQKDGYISSSFDTLEETELTSSSAQHTEGSGFKNFETYNSGFSSHPTQETNLYEELQVTTSHTAIQFDKGKYLAVDTPDGLAIVNIARARCRIEYEDILQESQGAISSQFLAVGTEVELSADEKSEVLGSIDKYESYGFKIEDNGGTSLKIMAMPVGCGIEDFMSMASEGTSVNIGERIARILTENILRQPPKKLSQEEISALFERLLGCEEPSYTASGLKVIEIISDMDNRFKR